MRMTGSRTALSLALALLAGPALAQDNPPPMISVTGEATVSAVPDVAEIESGVSTDAKTAREASDANNAAMGNIILALKGAGVPPKDYQTSRLSLQPQYASSSSRNGPNVITGYRASNRVTIRVRDVNGVATIIDTLVKAGANEMGGIGFAVSNASALLDQARPKAFANARRKAEIYAKAAGVTLGDPIRIGEGNLAHPVPMMRRASAEFAAAPVAPGEETLRVTVAVSWAIKPAR